MSEEKSESQELEEGQGAPQNAEEPKSSEAQMLAKEMVYYPKHMKRSDRLLKQMMARAKKAGHLLALGELEKEYARRIKTDVESEKPSPAHEPVE